MSEHDGAVCPECGHYEARITEILEGHKAEIERLHRSMREVASIINDAEQLLVIDLHKKP